MPKSATRPAWVIRSVSSRSAGVSVCGTAARGMWIVTGTTRRPGAASIITGRGGAGEVGEELGVAGEGEAGAVLQRLLVDRVGAERGAPRRCRASSTPWAMIATTAAAFAGSGRPGSAGRGSGWARTGRPSAIAAAASEGALDRADGEAEAGGEAGHVREVADQEERQPAAERRPGLERDLGADAGGVAEGQRDRAGHAEGTLAHACAELTAKTGSEPSSNLNQG